MAGRLLEIRQDKARLQKEISEIELQIATLEVEEVESENALQAYRGGFLISTPGSAFYHNITEEDIANLRKLGWGK